MSTHHTHTLHAAGNLTILRGLKWCGKCEVFKIFSGDLGKQSLMNNWTRSWIPRRYLRQILNSASRNNNWPYNRFSIILLFVNSVHLIYSFQSWKLSPHTVLLPLNQHNLSKQKEVMRTSNVSGTRVSDHPRPFNAIPALKDVTFTHIIDIAMNL